MIGAKSASQGGGVAYVFLGASLGALSSSPSLLEADALLYGGTNGDQAGAALAAGGDVDGDGYDDLVVGAPGVDVNVSNGGEAHLVFGPTLSSGGVLPLAVTDVGFNGPGNSSAGTALGSGDFNQDGLSDLLVGASGLDVPGVGSDLGGVYVLLSPFD